MIKKIPPVIHQVSGPAKGVIKMMGSKRAISTSKIRKITAIKKNRKEKGKRAELLGSNPHSKGELFSRSTIDFLERREARSITIIVIRIRIELIIKIMEITYTTKWSSWLEAKYTSYTM